MGPHVAEPPPAGATQVEELKELVMMCEPGTVAQHIKEARFLPRHNAFTSLLQLASKSRQPEKAIEICEAMTSIAGIAPNTFSYSALISALAKGGQWQQAERYFNEFRELGRNGHADMKPNKVLYAAMISGEFLLLFGFRSQLAPVTPLLTNISRAFYCSSLRQRPATEQSTANVRGTACRRYRP